MAKQVGLFPLRGKIENKSFYKTAGVPETVIRNIPEGLSDRVKTAQEYANTRLNNEEFKNANWMATFLFNAVPNRRSSMFRRFAIAALTKGALSYIRSGSGTWGHRIPTERFGAIALDLLDNHAKSGKYDGEFGILSYDIVQNNTYTLNLDISEAVVNEWLSLGVNGIFVVSVRGAGAEEVVDGSVRQYYGVSQPNVSQIPFTAGSGESDDFTSFIPSPQTLGMSPNGYTTSQGLPNNGMFAIVTFLPYRQEGANLFVLREYSTYAVLDLGAIPAA